MAWKMKWKTLNQQLIFVLVTFHILICVFLLHPIFLYSGGPNCSASSQTWFPRGQWLGCGRGSQPGAGGTRESSGHVGWAAGGTGLRGYSSSHSSWAWRCLHGVCCSGPTVHQDLWKVLCTFRCAEPSNLNEGIAAIFTEKCHIHVGSRLRVSVTVCQQGSKQMFRALSLPNQKVKGGLQPINTNNSAAFFSTYLMLCFFAAEHWLHQPVQQLCSRPAPVLAWRWALLVTGEGGLLPCISGHERMWGKLPGAERADRVSYRRLWGLDKNYYCYPQVACSQVLYIVNQWCQWYLWISCLFFDATLGKSYKLWIKAVLKIGRSGKNILCSPKWEKLSILKVPEWSIRLNYKATRNPEHFNLTSVSSSWCCLSLRISVRSEAPAREW